MENIMIDSANADLKKRKVSKKEEERLMEEQIMDAFVEEETGKISKDKKEMELETMIFGGDDERVKNTLDFIGHEFSDDEAEKFAKIYEFSDDDNDEIFGDDVNFFINNKFNSKNIYNAFSNSQKFQF